MMAILLLLGFNIPAEVNVGFTVKNQSRDLLRTKAK
jgi:hypothetical protein